MDDKELNIELVKKLINHFYFTSRVSKAEFITNTDSNQFNHIYSKLITTPRSLEFEKNHAINILKDIATVYARLINQNNFENRTVSSARFDKQDQVSDEVEFFIDLKNNKNVTESVIDIIDLDRN